MNSDAQYDVVVKLADEFIARLRQGEHPGLSEYADKYPHLADQIREVFPMMAMMEELCIDSTDDAVQQFSNKTAPEVASLEQIGEYRILREVGRGGMGIVFEAEQTSLRRHVALKVLAAHPQFGPTNFERFQREARAAAMLHHTNIVPVFDVGEHQGLAYYAMQFIHGQGLDGVLEELRRLRRLKAETGSHRSPRKHSRPAAETDTNATQVEERFSPHESTAIGRRENGGTNGTNREPNKPGALSESSVQLPGQAAGSEMTESGAQYWLSVARIGVQVSEALEHAHSRGTLHRDIKPSNLLLDAQGVVWVTDFGLAKLADEGDLTQSGEFVGTLRYMAPERFEGKSDALSDLYSLGLTLYELVTLRPAFQASERHELVRQVVQDVPPRPRKVNPLVPRDLETIVLKATAREPTKRYQSAAELGADLQRFIDDKPIQARRVAVAEHAWRWCRRNPSWAAFATALIVLIAGSLGAAFWYIQDRAERRTAEALEIAEAARKAARRDRDIESELKEASAFRHKAQALTDRPHDWRIMLASATAAVKRAELLLKNHPAAEQQLRVRVSLLTEQLVDDERNRRMLATLDKIRLDSAEVAVERGQFATYETIPIYRSAFATYGIDSRKTKVGAAVERIRALPESIRVALITAMDDWIFWTQFTPDHSSDESKWLRAVVAAADDDPWRARVRSAMARSGTTSSPLKKLAKEADVTQQPPASLALLARSLWRAGEGQTATELLRRAQVQYPANFWINEQLGLCLLTISKPQEAARYLTAACVLRPESPGALLNLGNAIRESGDYRGAIETFRQAIRLSPEYAHAYNNMGLALKKLGDYPKAIAAHRKAIEVQAGHGSAYTNLSSIFIQQRKILEADAACRKAIALNPHSAIAHTNLGLVLEMQGKRDAAIAAFRKALECDPKLGIAYDGLGSTLQRQGHLDEALKAFRRAAELDEHNADIHHHLGKALVSKGELQAAIDAFNQAIASDPRHAYAFYDLGRALSHSGRQSDAIVAYRRSVAFMPEYGMAWTNLGTELRTAGDLKGAVAAFRKAIEVVPRFALAHHNLSSTLIAQGEYEEGIKAARRAIELNSKNADSHFNLSIAYARQRDFDKAVAACQAAVRRAPKSARYLSQLGHLYRQQGDLPSSVKTCRLATQVDNNHAGSFTNLGIALFMTGDRTGALAAHRRAVAIAPDNALLHFNLGLTLAKSGDPRAAVTSFRKAIQRNPRYARAYFELGNALSYSGNSDAAEDAYRRAIELNPRHAEALTNLGIRLRARGELAAAVDCLRRAIKARPSLVQAHHSLGVVLAAQGDVRGARSAYATALRLEPNSALTHHNLGQLLVQIGQFEAALVSLERGHQLGSQIPGWNERSASRIRDCKYLIALEERFPKVADGKAMPADHIERVWLAKLCYYKRRYAASVGYFQKVIDDADPSAVALKRQFTLFAASAAARAGAGLDDIKPPLSKTARSEHRATALRWMKSEFNQLSRDLQSSNEALRTAARRALIDWQHDNQIATVRDESELAKLPKSERDAWRTFWKGVRQISATEPAAKSAADRTSRRR